MNTFKRFFEPVLKTKFIFFRGFIFILIQGLNLVAHVFFIQIITSSLENHNQEFFWKIIFGYIAYALVYEIFYFLSIRYTWPVFYNQSILNIQGEYFQKFVKLNNNTTETIGTGKLISIMKWGIEMWAMLIDIVFHRVPNILTTMIFTLFMLFQANSWYVVVFLFLYITFFAVTNFFNNRVIKLRKERSQNKILYTKNFVKILMSKYEILQSDKILDETRKLDFYQKKAIDINQKMSFDMTMIYRFSQFSMDLVLLAIFIFFGMQVFQWQMQISTFVGVTAMFVLMKRSIMESMDLYKNFTKEFIEVENLWDLFDNTAEISLCENGENFEYKNGNIEIKNLNFGYENTPEQIFANFSLTIQGGKTTAFVGESGSGKTTLIKIISGYIEAKNSEILIDGQNLAKISQKSYYQNIWYLTQEPSIFDGTIYENLAYGTNKKISEKEIENAIKLAKCEFIYDFENWLETEIGEKWIKLSGGQRQRLAIAKIFIKNPKIILLDEPTSALDSFSEEQITQAMNNLFAWRTVIIVAHRLQTVKNADEIFVFEKWKVIEKWNHESLEKAGGVYKKLLELQAGF